MPSTEAFTLSQFSKGLDTYAVLQKRVVQCNYILITVCLGAVRYGQEFLLLHDAAL